MPRKNKIIASRWKEYIDSELKKGVAYRDLSKDLKGKGFEISHTAIASYHGKYLSKDRSEASPPEQIEHEEAVDSIEFNEAIDPIETIKRSYKRQAQIFEHKQARYMQGLERFPSRELTALKDLQTVLKNHYSNASELNKTVTSLALGSYQDLMEEAKRLRESDEHNSPRNCALLDYFILDKAPSEKLLRGLIDAVKNRYTHAHPVLSSRRYEFTFEVRKLLESSGASKRQIDEAGELALKLCYDWATNKDTFCISLRVLFVAIWNNDKDFAEAFAYDVLEGAQEKHDEIGKEAFCLLNIRETLMGLTWAYEDFIEKNIDAGLTFGMLENKEGAAKAFVKVEVEEDEEDY